MPKNMKKEFPTLGGSVDDIVKALVEWVDANVQRRRWSDSEIDMLFANRSPRQIAEEGHTCFMNPCLDFASLAIISLEMSGFPAALFVEELKHNGYDHNRLHFAVEFAYGNKTYYIDFSTMNRVFLGKGKYTTSRSDVAQIGSARFEGRRFMAGMPFYAGLGLGSREEISKIFPGYDISPHIARLKRDNTAKTYERYLKVVGGSAGLRLEKVS